MFGSSSSFGTFVMSFGFSVGDFLVTRRLIKDIVAILRASTRLDYQELVLELDSLERALYRIEHLKVPPDAIAALMCTDRFMMASEARNLRAYLAALVVSRPLSLTSYIHTEQTGHIEAEVLETTRRIKTKVIQIHDNFEAAQRVSEPVQITIARLLSFLNGDVIAQLKSLANKSPKYGSLILRSLRFLPGCRHCWHSPYNTHGFKLLRIIPISLKFDWLARLSPRLPLDSNHGTLREHTRSSKSCCSEYELFNALDRRRVISRTSFKELKPGMSLAIVFAIRQYFDMLRQPLERNCSNGSIH
ncbi:uncharacterized protein BDR25DRAFT_396512 [Lindgomyces ingoldianus]|uniref:Uncharacterized protein n=1 Tax=Lindgomyces ingoldianus TaxID=673940 RepID=A0ACB6QDA4_9PLEO|nr:uncharacterized protein BDR25DRAFT_396512 [Lindgomyces ingoldianus]KAF2464876.1 hypothetical protein BDR25DRAFT_396512 [Lindgomyces ingoldianus]